MLLDGSNVEMRPLISYRDSVISNITFPYVTLQINLLLRVNWVKSRGRLVASILSRS